MRGKIAQSDRALWKILRSLALAGRHFESRDEIIDAVHHSAVYWNAHRHPFV
jgi:hypothetical protein